MKKYIILTTIILFTGILFGYFYKNNQAKNQDLSRLNNEQTVENENDSNSIFKQMDEPAKTKPSISLKDIPEQKTLQNSYHTYQTFNNCGPSSLSMALSYYGINASQQELGLELRPFQNSAGDNDDKSVTLKEMAKKAVDYNLITFYRPNGNIDIIKAFIAYDIPVITKTLLDTKQDIGHYRVVKGYQDKNQTLLQDDSLQGPNINFSYQEFDALWKKFNYEFMVIVPREKEEIAKTILGEIADESRAWEIAAENSRNQLKTNQDDVYARFNLVIALHNIGDHANAVKEFEKIENKLSPRSLWYQSEPIESYFQIGNYNKALTMIDFILNNGNRAYSELYVIRGNIYLEQNKPIQAKEQFETALKYNRNMDEAKEALAKLN